MDFFRNLSDRHEQLKKKIHGTRIPLSKTGRNIMAIVYFSIPIACGYGIMKWTESKAETNFHIHENQIRDATGHRTAQSIKKQNAMLQEVLEETMIEDKS